MKPRRISRIFWSSTFKFSCTFCTTLCAKRIALWLNSPNLPIGKFHLIQANFSGSHSFYLRSILFKICNSIQKNILKKLLELTFDKSAQHVTTMALILMRELQRKNPKHVQNCAMLLLPLLDRLSDLTLPQTRLAMDLLCHIAFPEPKLTECAPLQDQIEMVVKKQQINCSEYVKKQGIIGCVQLIDAVARIETIIMDNEDLQTSVESITSLPDGRSKQAANLISKNIKLPYIYQLIFLLYYLYFETYNHYASFPILSAHSVSYTQLS